MAGGIDWFRWHHGSVSDQKFGLVAKKASASVAEVIAVWACLLEAASAAEDRGNPGLPDFEAMDFALGLDDGKSRRIYERLRERLMLDAETGRIAAWEKRQPKRERPDDNSTERSRAHRERQSEPCNATQRHATPEVAEQHQETPRGEESREDTSPSLRSGEGASKRATRQCPKAFQVTEDMGKWASEKHPGADVAAETEKFRDHTFKTAITDWPGAWRNWIRKSAEFSPSKQNEPPPEQAAARQVEHTQELLKAQASIVPDPALARAAREALQARRLTT